MTTDADGLLTVRVVGLPVALMARAQQQSDELVRELTLIAEGLRQKGGTSELPSRLVTLVGRLSSQYAPFTSEQEQQIARAVASGASTVDLTYRVPQGAAVAARQLGEMLDEADDYCREGRYLLTLATPPDLVAYRQWFLDQFVEQAAGARPRPWSDALTH
jgi:hypothetical protein